MRKWCWVLFAGWFAVSAQAAVVEVVNPKTKKTSVKKAPKKPVKVPVNKPFWQKRVK